MRVKKVRTYSMLVVDKEGFEDVILRDLEKAGLESPDDIEDIEYLEDGTKIRYTFWIEKEEK